MCDEDRACRWFPQFGYLGRYHSGRRSGSEHVGPVLGGVPCERLPGTAPIAHRKTNETPTPFPRALPESFCSAHVPVGDGTKPLQLRPSPTGRRRYNGASGTKEKPMKNAHRLTATIALTLITLAAGTATATEGVSPGAIDRVAVVNNACPTFSWGEDDNAAAYELVAYRLPKSEQEAAELSSENEVLFASVAGAATSWTPSADQCFAGGGRYVWFVRSVTELIDDQVVEAGEWSAGRYFSVPAGPSETDVARAIEVLKQWEVANRGGSLMLSSAAAAAAAAVPVPVPAAASATGSGSSHPKSVPTASAAIRGQHPDMSGEVYGVVGTSASADGAGVAAANLDGGLIWCSTGSRTERPIRRSPRRGSIAHRSTPRSSRSKTAAREECG